MQPIGNDMGIPHFDKSGKALSQEERAKIATRQGKCLGCGIRTHQVSVMRKVPQTNDNVHKGICIKCYPTKVPADILQAYKQLDPLFTTGVPSSGSDPQTRQPQPRPARATPAPLHATDRGARTTTRPNRPVRTRSNPKKTGTTPALERNATAPIRQGGPSTRGIQPPAMVRAATSGVVQNRGPRRTRTTQPRSPHSGGHPRRRPPGNLPTVMSVLDLPFDPNSSDTSLSMADDSFHTQSSRQDPLRMPKKVVNEDYLASKLSEEDRKDLTKALMDAHQDNDKEKMKQALHAIRNKGEVGDPLEAVAAIREVIFQHFGDSRVMATSCGALWRIVVDYEDSKIDVVENGIMDSLLESLDKDNNDPDFVSWCLGLIACLARDGKNKELIVRGGAIKTILQVIPKNSSSAGVLEWSARALHALIFWPDQEGASDFNSLFQTNIATIEEANGVPLIVGAMKKHVSETVVEGWALKLLWRLLATHDDSIRQRMLAIMKKENLIETCVKVLRRASPEVYQMAIDLICCVLTASPGDEALFAAAADAASQTVRTMGEFSDNETLQESCCTFFATLLMGNVSSRYAVISHRGANAMSDALVKYPNNASIVESGTYALWCLSFGEHVDIELAKTMSAVVQKAVKVDLTANSHLFLPIYGFSANTTLQEGVSPPDILIDEVLVSLEREAGDLQLLKQAQVVITNYCAIFPDEADRVVAKLNIDDLVNMMLSGGQQSDEVCQFLSAIALKCDPIRSSLLSSEALTAVLDCLNTAESLFFKQSLMEFFAILTLPGEKGVQLPNDMLAIMMDVIHTDHDSNDLLERACGIIRNSLLAAASPPSPPDLEGVWSGMVDVITSNEASVKLQIEACNVLWTVTSKYGSKQDGNDLLTGYRALLGLLTQYKDGNVPFDYDLFNCAAGALASIADCMRTAQTRISSEDVDEIISVPYVALEYEADRVEPYVRLLDAVYSLSWIDDEMVCSCGSIVVVIDTMAEFENFAEIQELGCAILGLLAATENLQVLMSIVQTDGVDMIINALALHAKNKSVTAKAVKALAHVSIDAESRILITSLGGLTLIGNGMRESMDDVEMIKGAMSALLSLSSDADLGLLQEAKTVHVAVEAMNYYSSSIDIQDFGMGILQNLSMRKFEAKQTIAEAGGIEAVANAIKEFMGSPAILERAFTTLWSLAVLDSNQILIADADGINLVVNGMMTALEYEDVQKQGCGCLCTLSTDSENKGIIQNVGGVDCIVFAMWAHYHSEGIQIEATRALSSLAVDAATNEVMIAGESEISAMLSAMRRFPESELLQEQSCITLRNFLLSADNVEFLRGMAEEITLLVSDAAARFPVSCSERAGQVLASLV